MVVIFQTQTLTFYKNLNKCNICENMTITINLNINTFSSEAAIHYLTDNIII